MSQNDMLKAAEAEVLRLEAAIAKTPLGQKLALAKQVVDMWRSESLSEIVSKINEGDMQRAAEAVARQMNGTHTTKTAAIEKICADHLRSKRARATSGELAEVVTRSGIHLSGVTPSKSLAALLSHSDLFDNIRSDGGYGLKEWSQRHEERETATSE